MPYVIYTIDSLPDLGKNIDFSEEEKFHDIQSCIESISSGQSHVILFTSGNRTMEPVDVEIISIIDRHGEEHSINRNAFEFAWDNITLYHGTTHDSAVNISTNGWSPHSGTRGNQYGNTALLYTSTMPESALYYAQEKGDDSILEIKTKFKDLVVDPEDGMGDNIWQEYFSGLATGLPCNLAIKLPISAQQVKHHNKDKKEHSKMSFDF